MTTKTIAGAAALVAFGLGCAALGARWGSSSAPVPSGPRAAAATAHLSIEERAELRRELAEDVRRAVAAGLPAAQAKLATASAEPAPAAAPPAALPPGPAHPEAQEAAHRIITDAVARGSWHPEDGQALRAALGELNQVEIAQLLGELERAVNTGRVQIVARDRPLL